MKAFLIDVDAVTAEAERRSHVPNSTFYANGSAVVYHNDSDQIDILHLITEAFLYAIVAPVLYFPFKYVICSRRPFASLFFLACMRACVRALSLIHI